MNWTHAGAEWSDTAEKRAGLLSKSEHLTWHGLDNGKVSAPFSQGYALQRIMGDVLGNHKKIAWDGIVGNCALLGLETQRGQETVRSYWVDFGTGVSCVCYEGW